MINTAVTEGLAGLDEGLRVRHIATFPVVTCAKSDGLKDVLLHPDFLDFDQIPITQGQRIIGILERSEPAQLRRLDDSVLVSADDLLSHFVHTVHEQQYRLVVDRTAISGIVTWSDLLKLPVIVLAFSVIAQLELAMNQRINEQYGRGSDTWLEVLEKGERAKIAGRRKKLKSQNLTLPTIELVDLVHKAKVLRHVLSARRDFEADLGKIVGLRNDVAHVKRIIRSSAGLKVLVDRLETAETWLRMLGCEAKAAAASGPL
jgi:hypothetical protein